MSTCDQLVEYASAGAAPALRAVDCLANQATGAAFGRLFGTDGALLPALTILLTLYIASFAVSLLAGRSRIGISALTPRMMTLGLVLTFATSWVAYQGVVWNLAVGAPDQLASVLTGTEGSATQVFADKIDIVFATLIEATGQQATEGPTSTFSPQGLLWLGATLLLLGTVGLLATCKIALAILLALGPVFVVMALFKSARGLFTGWLKGVVLLAITPLFAVLGGSLTLELAVPTLRALTQTPGLIDPRAAMAFFMIAAIHAALMIMVLKVAGTMVAGWTVFGFARSSLTNEVDGKIAAATAATREIPVTAAAAASTQQSRSSTHAPSREIRIAGGVTMAANDLGPARTGIGRKSPVSGGTALGMGAAAAKSHSRTRGIGSRFRASPIRSTEKFK